MRVYRAFRYTSTMDGSPGSIQWCLPSIFVFQGLWTGDLCIQGLWTGHQVSAKGDPRPFREKRCNGREFQVYKHHGRESRQYSVVSPVHFCISGSVDGRFEYTKSVDGGVSVTQGGEDAGTGPCAAMYSKKSILKIISCKNRKIFINMCGVYDEKRRRRILKRCFENSLKCIQYPASSVDLLRLTRFSHLHIINIEVLYVIFMYTELCTQRTWQYNFDMDKHSCFE